MSQTLTVNCENELVKQQPEMTKQIVHDTNVEFAKQDLPKINTN